MSSYNGSRDPRRPLPPAAGLAGVGVKPDPEAVAAAPAAAAATAATGTGTAAAPAPPPAAAATAAPAPLARYQQLLGVAKAIPPRKPQQQAQQPLPAQLQQPQQPQQHQQIRQQAPQVQPPAQQRLQSPPQQQGPPRCALCLLGAEACEALGELLEFDLSLGGGSGSSGGAGNSSSRQPRTAMVHSMCAQWAPQAYWVGDQPGAQHGLMKVPQEVRRARQLKCKLCKHAGAAMGCDVKSCQQTYHLSCAMLTEGTRFNWDSWCMYCPAHAHRCAGRHDVQAMRKRRQVLWEIVHGGQPLPEGLLEPAVADDAEMRVGVEQGQGQEQQQQQGIQGEEAGESSSSEEEASSSEEEEEESGSDGDGDGDGDASAQEQGDVEQRGRQGCSSSAAAAAGSAGPALRGGSQGRLQPLAAAATALAAASNGAQAAGRSAGVQQPPAKRQRTASQRSLPQAQQAPGQQQAAGKGGLAKSTAAIPEAPAANAHRASALLPAPGAQAGRIPGSLYKALLQGVSGPLSVVPQQQQQASAPRHQATSHSRPNGGSGRSSGAIGSQGGNGAILRSIFQLSGHSARPRRQQEQQQEDNRKDSWEYEEEAAAAEEQQQQQEEEGEEEEEQQEQQEEGQEQQQEEQHEQEQQQKEQQREQQEVGQLPEKVRQLVADVFGMAVTPVQLAQAEAYLWLEGVREFSDLKFLDYQDFFRRLPFCTHLLLNKLFALAAERGAPSAVLPTAAGALAPGP